MEEKKLGSEGTIGSQAVFFNFFLGHLSRCWQATCLINLLCSPAWPTRSPSASQNLSTTPSWRWRNHQEPWRSLLLHSLAKTYFPPTVRQECAIWAAGQHHPLRGQHQVLRHGEENLPGEVVTVGRGTSYRKFTKDLRADIALTERSGSDQT